MLITGIKSKPIYTPLSFDASGRYHILLGAGVGANPLLRVLAEMKKTVPQSMIHARVLFKNASAIEATAGNVSESELAFRAVETVELRVFNNVASLLADFHILATGSLMGTRLYVAGPESFIGLAMQIALQFNLNQDEIRAEECGSLARRVFCIHCRAITDEVVTNIVKCACQRWLLVRDHYSRRLAAYMGVMADAEAPGELPEMREVFR